MRHIPRTHTYACVPRGDSDQEAQRKGAGTVPYLNTGTASRVVNATELVHRRATNKVGQRIEANFCSIARQCGRQPIATYRACQPKIWL